jgi:hypothetical protein
MFRAVGRRSRQARSWGGGSHHLVFEPLELRRLLAFNPYVVDNTNDAGAGSLREGIIQVDLNNFNDITFDIPAGPYVITPQSPLPSITSPVLIDGYSQPGTAQDSGGTSENAVILIQIDGSALAGNGFVDSTGLEVNALNVTIDGLSITNFTGPAISLQPPAGSPPPNSSAIGDDIWGNYIGVAPDGATEGNQAGVIVDTTNNLIGGTIGGARNVIAGSTDAGVILYGTNGSSGQGDLVEGNSILNNGGDGVLVLSANNVVGGALSGAGNQISGNGGSGVDILGPSASGNIVAGNTIGGAEEESFLPNTGDGVLIDNAPGNLVGGAVSSAANTIGGNSLDGTAIENFPGLSAVPAVPTLVGSIAGQVDTPGDNATANRVEGNTIGNAEQNSTEDPTPNRDGVFISSSGNTVGGTTSLAANIIIGNERNGITISPDSLDASDNNPVALANADPIDNLVVGNQIGTLSGLDDDGNTLDGVLLYAVTSNTIGGAGSGTANVISGNNSGVVIMTGSGNVVAGNLIGVTSAGSFALGNAVDGITVDNSSGNTVGGTVSGSGNVISGNTNGLDLTGAGTTSTDVWDNLIGTDETGLLPIGNANDGVIIQNDADVNEIGATTTGAGAGNTIGFNVAAGVQIVSGTGNSILTNSIFSNDQGGIALYAGLSQAIVEPVLQLATPNAATDVTNIQGSYDPGATEPNATFIIQFFGNVTADASGAYEGMTFLGATTVTTNATGMATIDANLTTVVASGTEITATATSVATIGNAVAAGDSSQFSAAVEAINVFLVTSIDSSGVGSLAAAIAYSDLFPSVSPVVPNEIDFQLADNGLQTISLTAPLPAITAPVIINGYSQAGSSTNVTITTSDDEETDVAVINVGIDGSLLSPALDANGLVIDAPNTTIEGLAITGFADGAGIYLEPESNALGDTITGNFIGVNQFNPVSFNPVQPAANSTGNEFGIWASSSNNLIGGTITADRNVIQGNQADGIVLYGSLGTKNKVENNFILDNGTDGLLVMSADNQIGLATAAPPAGAGNVISGNHGNGVHILGPSAVGNVLVNNQIGTQIGEAGLTLPIRGTEARPNLGDGVLIENAPQNVIGGLIPNAGNAIAANGGDGIGIENFNTGTVPATPLAAPSISVNSPADSGTANDVEGNEIGFSERSAIVYVMPNNQDGVDISSAGNVVGGDTYAAQNIIIENSRNGVTISADLLDSGDNPLSVYPNPDPDQNLIAGNYIGTVAGDDDYGNSQDGVFLFGAGDNTIGGATAAYQNVIAGNDSGVVIESQTSTGNLVADNLIGTTAAGTDSDRNTNYGVEVSGAVDNTIGGALGISGNLISGNGTGVYLTGAGATGNVVTGNLIGTDQTGTRPLPNTQEGVLIDAAVDNTIGGTTATSGNVISANQWGVVIEDGGTGNLLEGNDVGTDITGQLPLGNTLDGVLVNQASSNTIGGTGAGQGNTIAFNLDDGVSIVTGTGNSILSNAIDSNGQGEIVLSAGGNDDQSAPLLAGVSASAQTSSIQGSLISQPATYLIQFFASTSTDSSGNAQGETLIGALTQVVTGSAQSEAFSFSLAGGVPFGIIVSATATDEQTGDTSAFAAPSTAEPVSVGFAAGPFVVNVNASANVGGTAVIPVDRSGELGLTVTVNYATLFGSAIAGKDYTAVSGTLTFPPNTVVADIDVPILVNPERTESPLTVELALSQPAGGATVSLPGTATLLIVDSGSTITTFDVVNTSSSGPGSLDAAIAAANLAPNPSTDNVVFEIPASTAPDLDVPVAGFDPTTQTWQIVMNGPLPVITHAMSIDGYSEANVAVPYLYPDQVSSAVQSLTISGDPTGGSFTLTTAAPLPVGITAALPYDASALQVQEALEAIIGAGNVAVTGGPLPATALTVSFQGAYADLDIPNLYAGGDFTGGIAPTIAVATTTAGGAELAQPTAISSVANSTAALDGNNAQIRVVIDGTETTGLTGLVVAASDSIIRGLAIEGFNVGIDIAAPTDVGDLIQGNSIGDYLAYPVDPDTGVALPSPYTVALAGQGNAQQGLVLSSANATVGGTDLQDSNVICGNGAQGILIEPGGSGNQILNNQIGVVGPSTDGLYFQDGNGGPGVDIESVGTAGDPSSIVFASSNVIGGATSSSGNIISDNLGAGVLIDGVGATRNLVEANFIGLAPGGGYKFGNGQPGNRADGVLIDNAPDNQVGGLTSAAGNVISSNEDNGVNIEGANALGNTVESNIIGLISSGDAVLGNDQAGVNDTAPGTVIGPGNVISANLVGVSISGAAASGVIVRGNLIGTDSSGTLDLGNAEQGVEIDGTTGVIVEGDGDGSQVISGNLVGVEIDGSSTPTDDLIQGNFIGTDKSGASELGNSNQGILLEGAAGNTIGGTTTSAGNVISANQWGVQLDGALATANLVEGNDVGTDSTGLAGLGNEINGILFTNNAPDNTVGGTGAGQGNIIAFNVEAGVSVLSGTGDSILSNSIFSNGQAGIYVAAALAIPSLTGASGGGTGSNIQGSITSSSSDPLLIQFFSSPVADPSGFGQGQTFLGSTTITPVLGVGTISFNLPSGVAIGSFVTATATDVITGDTSQFSNALAAKPVTVAFAMASYTVNSTAVVATIDVQRFGNLAVAVSVDYATSNGSAVAGQDYTAVAGTLTFPVNATDESFTVPILNNPNNSSGFSTVNLTLSQPIGGANLGAIASATLIIVNNSNPSGIKSFVVYNTADSGPGSLRQAIIDADSGSNPGVDNIVFAIPASTAANLNVPVAGFDPIDQTWTITLQTALPAITHAVNIDAGTQAAIGVPYRYPDQVSSAVQTLAFVGVPTGGGFALTTSAPLPAGTTPLIPYSASADQIQTALQSIIPDGDVSVTGGPLPDNQVIITFQGAYAGVAIPNLIASNSLTGGGGASIEIETTVVGGLPISDPTDITSITNSVAALDGNNARLCVVVDGSQTGGGTGFVLNASDSAIRGLIIEGFGIGVSIPSATDNGDLIQGDAIGEFLEYPVDPDAGTPLPSPDTVSLAGLGNTLEGIVLGSANTTVGGTDPEDANVICGNGAQGILIEPGASGNQVLGNQIGIAGPGSSGYYFKAGNGTDGVDIESLGTAGNPSSIVYASSNVIGGPTAAAGNLISGNHGYGVLIDGVGATLNLVEANYIGPAPGGGYTFAEAQPGNLADGVLINNAPDNQIGGASTSAGNVISANQGNGVNITGVNALGNTVENNVIGLTVDGTTRLGNDQAGVADTAPATMIGPGNLISANLVGVSISGALALGLTVTGDLIGTDISGTLDLGNAKEGVEIQNAGGVVVEGNGQGSQVISGNLIGVEIDGSSSTQNLVEGNDIGTDKSGTAPLGNSNQGILLEGAADNTIGGTTAAARNVISANQWGIQIDGSTATANLVEGNDVGTDSTGTAPLGNEINGILVSGNASNNTIGGTASGQGNTIAYNAEPGVDVQSGTGDSILSNSIFANARGIVLNVPTNANDLLAAPALLTAIPNTTTQLTNVQGTYSGEPNTSFLIQFFSNLAADPLGFYEGQTFLGSTIVSTGASGSATFSVNLPTVVPADAWVTATATSLSTVALSLTTGDSSEFSTAIATQPVSVAFETAEYTANASDGFATIYVVRVGNPDATVSVNYATSNGSGVAGRDYSAASGTLTFPAGQFTETFNVTLLLDPSANGDARTVNLALSQPEGGATLGSINKAVLTINEVPNQPPPPSQTTPPAITSEQLILGGRSITAIVLTFSKPLNPVRAEDLSNFGYYLIAAGSTGAFGSAAGAYATLSSAVYNATADTVTLTPSAPLPSNRFYRITIDGQANPLLHNGVTDLAGNQLAGSSGAPGTPYVVTFGVGTKLAYTDSGRNLVSLRLTKGGLIEIFRTPTGVVQEMELIGTVPGKSTLSGTVSRAPGGTGRTYLPAIGGAAGTRIRLKKPPFYISSPTMVQTAARALVIVKTKAGAKPSAQLFSHRPWHRSRAT